MYTGKLIPGNKYYLSAKSGDTYACITVTSTEVIVRDEKFKKDSPSECSSYEIIKVHYVIGIGALQAVNLSYRSGVLDDLYFRVFTSEIEVIEYHIKQLEYNIQYYEEYILKMGRQNTERIDALTNHREHLRILNARANIVS